MKILNILSSISAENSNTAKLVNVINEKLLATYPKSVVVTRDLAKNQLPHLEAAHLLAFASNPDELSIEEQANRFQSDAAVTELIESDIIVLAVPFYNFSIPGTLKSWIDQIVRAGVTFTYENGALKGIVSGKKVYLALASGGIYSEGAMKDSDFAEPYLRKVLGVLGLTDITTFRVEGTKVPGVMETAFEKASAEVSEFAF